MSIELGDYWAYVAWIRNLQFPREDQDGEYCSVILIKTPSDVMAKSWGDQMFSDAIDRDPDLEFMFSDVHRPDDDRYTSGLSTAADLQSTWSDCPSCRLNQRLPDRDLC